MAELGTHVYGVKTEDGKTYFIENYHSDFGKIIKVFSKTDDLLTYFQDDSDLYIYPRQDGE